ncbi:MAG: hypothetical protein ISR35_05935, partial [Planctomycetes bacterium]|nr:hypothetical protein [Planctomycetota bacterium]
INANCGIYYPEADWGSADICLSLDPAGHAGFTRQLVAAAFGRHRRNMKDQTPAGVEPSPTDSSETNL